MTVNNDKPWKTHINLNVTDVKKSIEFYQIFFGTNVHKVRPGYANFDLDMPPLKLALQEVPQLEKTGPLNHLGIVMPTQSEYQARKSKLVASGLHTMEEENTTCCFAVQDKIWAFDPDGNAWEVYFLVDDMLSEGSSCGTGNKVGCCLPTTNSPVSIKFGEREALKSR